MPLEPSKVRAAVPSTQEERGEDGDRGRKGTVYSAPLRTEPLPMTEPIAKLRDNITRVFFGNTAAVDRVICCLLARGHVLIEDVPGVGKTVLAMALARSIGCSFSRIQMTSDMLPGDVLGVSVYNRETGEFVFKPGPVFANIVLADEINRTTPRTQTALLEAMNEATVSIEGRVYHLGPPFMVVATQNPFDFEGTYLLPENQLDRFLMRTQIGYPDPGVEASVLALRPADSALPNLEPVLSREQLLGLQERVEHVRVERSLLEYIVAFANATRRHEELQVGLSTRGALALAQAARATAVLADRDYAVPEDILANVVPVCAHRVITRSYARGSEGGGSETDGTAEILRSILQTVPSPA